jgi:hypothetical protein
MGAELNERSALSGRAIEYGDLMSSPYEVGRHRGAHASESDESKFHARISM